MDIDLVKYGRRAAEQQLGGLPYLMKRCLYWLMADEIERLRKMLTDHGIDPDAEYIAPNGLRVDAPRSKNNAKF